MSCSVNDMKINLQRKPFFLLPLLVMVASSTALAKVKREHSKVDDATLFGVQVPFVSKNDGLLGMGKAFEFNVSYTMAFWTEGNISKGPIDKAKWPSAFRFAISKEIQQTRGYSEEAHAQKWEGADSMIIIYRPKGQPKEDKPKRIEIKAEYKHSLGQMGQGSYSTESIVGDVPMETAMEMSQSTDVTVAVENSESRFGEFDINQKHMKGMQEICAVLEPANK